MSIFRRVWAFISFVWICRRLPKRPKKEPCGFCGAPTLVFFSSGKFVCDKCLDEMHPPATRTEIGMSAEDKNAIKVHQVLEDITKEIGLLVDRLNALQFDKRPGVYLAHSKAGDCAIHGVPFEGTPAPFPDLNRHIYPDGMMYRCMLCDADARLLSSAGDAIRGLYSAFGVGVGYRHE